MGLMAGAAMGVIVFVCAMIAPEKTARALAIVKIALTSFLRLFRKDRRRETRAVPVVPDDPVAHRPAVKAPPTISDFARPPMPRERVRDD